ncbi:hypothetical protein [Rheinheimera texasensis]|uniref:hypothetical protein n=1 Tax=Rheinheimera texasensis TaxID=306205 RepID=UPI0032B22A72
MDTKVVTENKVWYRPVELVCIVIVILLVSMLKFADVKSRAMLEHDEGITLLGVTGHQGEFTRLTETNLLDQWQEASAWQHYVSVSPDVPLRQIQHDLNLHDIHPPMYFWALSVFLQQYGQFDRLAYLLNGVFALAAMLMFYLLLRLQFARFPALCLFAALAFTPALAGPYAVLRQYELMLCCGTGCLLMLSHLVSAQAAPARLSVFASLGFILFAYFGLMTHAQFVLVLAGLCTAVVFLPVLWRIKFLALGAAALAALLFVISNPEFFHTLERLQVQRQDASVFEFLRRLMLVVDGLDELVGLLPVTSALLFAGLMLWAIWQCSLSFSGKKAEAFSNILPLFWLYSAVLVIGLLLLQYLSMNSPRHAMGGRYFLPLLPFFILLVALWLMLRRWLQYAWLPAVLLFSASANLLAVEMQDRAGKEQQIAKAMQQAKTVLINNPTRGVLGPMLPILPHGGQVAVMSSQVRPAKMLALSDRLQSGDILWLQPGHQVSADQCADQLELLQHRLILREIGEKSGVYLVLRRIE